MMVGLEIRDAVVVALAVGEDGTVHTRADVAERDPGAAALHAIDRLVAASASSSAIGVASANPDNPAIGKALASIASRFSERSIQSGAFGSGTACAVAEAWVGAARGLRDVVYFAVGEHAIAGVIRDGRVAMGTRRRAPAIAWLSLNPVEREDYRKVGCLEAEVAAAGIVRRLIWRIKAGDRSRVQDMVKGDWSAITLNHLLDAAREGDGVSISVVRDTAKYLGMAAANLVAIADPDTLVLGGIMASAGDLLLDPVRTELMRRLPGPMAQALTIATASLGEDAAAIGAARLAAVALQ